MCDIFYHDNVLLCSIFLLLYMLLNDLHGDVFFYSSAIYPLYILTLFFFPKRLVIFMPDASHKRVYMHSAYNGQPIVGIG